MSLRKAKFPENVLLMGLKSLGIFARPFYEPVTGPLSKVEPSLISKVVDCLCSMSSMFPPLAVPRVS